MSEVVNFWTSLMLDYAQSLFAYQIVSGVTFASFIIAVMIMSIVVTYFFRRFIRSDR